MRYAIAAASLALAGCASPAPDTWTKEAGDLSADMARCEYEAAAATQGTDPAMRTIIGQELDRAIRRKELARMCMTAKGWRRG
jgi:hypothetical protein